MLADLPTLVFLGSHGSCTIASPSVFISAFAAVSQQTVTRLSCTVHTQWTSFLWLAPMGNFYSRSWLFICSRCGLEPELAAQQHRRSIVYTNTPLRSACLLQHEQQHEWLQHVCCNMSGCNMFVATFLLQHVCCNMFVATCLLITLYASIPSCWLIKYTFLLLFVVCCNISGCCNISNKQPCFCNIRTASIETR